MTMRRTRFAVSNNKAGVAFLGAGDVARGIRFPLLFSWVLKKLPIKMRVGLILFK